MGEIMGEAHEFLRNFCLGNTQNQALLHKHLDLFLTPGVSFIYISWLFPHGMTSLCVHPICTVGVSVNFLFLPQGKYIYILTFYQEKIVLCTFNLV